MCFVKYYREQGYEICYNEPNSREVMLEYIDKNGILQQKFVTFLSVENANEFANKFNGGI
jgi:hypothetical protein